MYSVYAKCNINSNIFWQICMKFSFRSQGVIHYVLFESFCNRVLNLNHAKIFFMVILLFLHNYSIKQNLFFFLEMFYDQNIRSVFAKPVKGC